MKTPASARCLFAIAVCITTTTCLTAQDEQGGRQVPEELNRLNDRYERTLSTVQRDYGTRMKELYDFYNRSLRQLRDQYSKEGREQDALLVDAQIRGAQAWYEAHAPDLVVAPEPEVDASALPAEVLDEELKDKLALSPFWQAGRGKAGLVGDDVARLFARLGEAEVDLKGYTGVNLWRGITYLMPLDEALKIIKLDRGINKRGTISTPVLPDRTFISYSYDGSFGGGFGALQLIVDQEQQVVAILLLDQSPSGGPRQSSDQYQTDWNVYNLALNRRKSRPDWRVRHTVAMNGRQKSNRVSLDENELLIYVDDMLEHRINRNDPPDRNLYPVYRRYVRCPVMQIDSELISYDSSNGEWKARERSRLILPQPLVNLMLDRIEGK